MDKIASEKALNSLAHKIHINAEQHGFWETPIPTFGDSLLLVTTELTEAFEEYRNHHSIDEIYYICKDERSPVYNKKVTKISCDSCSKSDKFSF